MSARPGSSGRPSHIPLPTTPYNVRPSPNESPLPTPTGTAPPLVSPTSPRSSFLPSFMRTRSRAATITHASGRGTNGGGSPTHESSNSSGTMGSRREPERSATTGGVDGTDGGNVTRSLSTPSGVNYQQLSGVNGNESSGNVALSQSSAAAPDTSSAETQTFRIRLVPHLESTRSLAFEPVIRDLFPIFVPPGIDPGVAAASVTSGRPMLNGRLPALLLKVGRFTDKGSASSQSPLPSTAVGGTFTANGYNANSASSTGGANGVGEFGNVASSSRGAAAPSSMGMAGGGGDTGSSKVAFKSKVVSRAHAEIWCEAGGKFFIRDTSSSSGTFLNHIRLSSPNVASRPQQLNDGDTLQLGVDFQGGTEEMFRCVKMRVEVGREWQRGANEFNTNALKQLKALGGAAVSPDAKNKTEGSSSTKKVKASVTDCCICLFSVTVCQSLFIAPCSHVFHYKCIRPLLLKHHPGFSCPLCRTFANLEEDVETEDAWEIASRRASVISRRPSNHSIRLPPPTDTPAPPGTSARPGLPSTGVGFDPASASVEELLGGNSEDTSEDGMIGSSRLTRQATAVQGDSVSDRTGMDIDMPQAVLEESNGQESTPTSILPPVSANPSQPLSIAVPILSGWQPQQSGSSVGFDEATTPMNDMFLSTLAGTGVHQRLAQAAEGSGSGSGSRGHEILEEDVEAEAEAEATASGSEGQSTHEQAGSTVLGSRGDGKNGLDSRNSQDIGEEDGASGERGMRGDIEMMFT